MSRPGELRFIAWTSPRPQFVGGPNALTGPRIGDTQTFAGMSYPAYTALRDGSRMFSHVACWSDISEARPVVIGESGFGTIHFVSGNYFDALGVRAANGRTIMPSDDQLGVLPTVAMISHPFWTRAFGRDRQVTQHTLLLNGRSFAIVGVMPESFFGLDPSTTPDVVLPMNAIPIAAATANALMRPDFWTGEVIGLVADSRTQSRVAAQPAMYWPLAGFGGPVTVTVRTSLGASQLVPAIRRAVGELHANVSTFGETTVAELRERQLRQERLLSAF